jgi:hypothetical protein
MRMMERDHREQYARDEEVDETVREEHVHETAPPTADAIDTADADSKLRGKRPRWSISTL